jgi:hypothetical protein
MLALEIFYIAIATVAVMAILQLVTFIGAKLMYPPEPKIIYQQVPVYSTPPPPAVQAPVEQPLFPPANPNQATALRQDTQEVQLPEYEPRKPASTSLRVDPELPVGLQETRPDGT